MLLVGSLTNCGRVTPYGALGFGQHCFRLWLVTWRHQAITRTNGDLPTISSSGIHSRGSASKLYSEIIVLLPMLNNWLFRVSTFCVIVLIWRHYSVRQCTKKKKKTLIGCSGFLLSVSLFLYEDITLADNAQKKKKKTIIDCSGFLPSVSLFSYEDITLADNAQKKRKTLKHSLLITDTFGITND